MTSFNPKTYFEDIEVWPAGSRSMTMSYVIGFVLSVLFTIGAYNVVTHHLFSVPMIVVVIVAFALLQFVTQMICFLHLGMQASSRDRLIVLGFAGLVVSILVGGSLWIMHSLNGRMMPTPAQMEQYMNDQTGI